MNSHRTGPRSSGLSADIDNVGALLDHLAGMGERGLDINKTTPVRKGIGGRIQNAHYQRPR